MNNYLSKSVLFLVAICFLNFGNAQTIIQEYQEAKNNVIKIGASDDDTLQFIEKGYTLAMPDSKSIEGIVLFFEDSGFDKKNKSASQIYSQASKSGFAVLSVSTEIPLDFFFSNNSMSDAHDTIQKAFTMNSLPNKNVFIVGVGLSGHRALRYVEYTKKEKIEFELDLSGLVICDAPLDWVRQFGEGKRDVRINFDEGAVWEGSFSQYVLKENLQGTPETDKERYLDFSTYSYFDPTDRHIQFFKDYPMRTYMEIAIQYWLEKKRKTPFDNNGPDMVGLVAQMKLAGNNDSELVIIYPDDSKEEKKNTDATWKAVDKDELMKWIINYSKV